MSKTHDLSDEDGVVVTPDSQKYHRSHPSALLHLACNPEVRGQLSRLTDVSDRDPCDHPACFGGPNDQPEVSADE